MTREEIWNRAEKLLFELYGETPDIRKSLSVLKLKYIILLTWYQTYYSTRYATL